MIHYVARFSRNAADSPLGEALRATGLPHRVFGVSVALDYRHRWQLLLLGYPRLVLAALPTAVASLIRARPRPQMVVVSSDVEALLFRLVRALPGAAPARLALAPFIFTRRQSPVLNRIRRFYYWLVLRGVAVAVCHSSPEIARYAALFPGHTRFLFVPWGTYVPPAAIVEAECGPLPTQQLPCIVSAGRSGRDYPLLVRAAAGLPARLTLICNEAAALDGVEPSAQVQVLDRCFGLDYLQQLRAADIVVVPLRVQDISAGQMVFIQAMAYARPLIVTRTPAVEDYLTHGQEALLVPRNDEAALRAAMHQLLDNPVEAAAMGARARARYEASFSNEAYLQALMAAL